MMVNITSHSHPAWMIIMITLQIYHGFHWRHSSSQWHMMIGCRHFHHQAHACHMMESLLHHVVEVNKGSQQLP